MNLSSKVKSFFSGIVDDNELEKIANETKNEEQKTPDESFIVYFKGDRPDTVWQYFHNPKDGLDELDDSGNSTGKKRGYGRLYGYWDDDRKFVENISNNLKLMNFETFMEKVPPNKDCTKIFESEADFLLELI